MSIKTAFSALPSIITKMRPTGKGRQSIAKAVHWKREKIALSLALNLT